jgi:uncharacterized protein YyaL (SSP411 family)
MCVVRWLWVLLIFVGALATAERAIDAQEAKKNESAKSAPPPRNRLAKETSPYLLLHAHNPVDWYPWGEEALERARREKKLIFLSIGYSSCYWCHVMERESFMDEQIAATLNDNFVCIKVDREERPDVDEIYMQALHIYLQLVGSKQGGGWPLSMFLTPDAKPLMGGTYFPPRDKDGRMGFATVLDRVREAWTADPQKWQKTGDSLADYVADSLKQRPMLKVAKLDAAMVDSVLRALVAQYDETYGGFGFDPASPKQTKFPEPPNLTFLLDYARRNKSEAAKTMLTTTLEKISQGGIRDHVGGGFHRYSTDRFWRVPHFEKMLYDNGQLLAVYTQAYELTPRSDFKRVVDETVEFLLREMSDPPGGFYSALDAETDSQEGRYYVWGRNEIEQALEANEYELWADVYGVAGEPNFEGRYIPLLAGSLADAAAKRNVSEAALDERLQPIRKKLLEVRSKRPRPLTDTKILTAWNGLVIRGLADAGRVFQNERYTAAAARAADFILVNLRDSSGRLQRTFAGGKAKVPAYLDDYAFMVDGLIALHRATGDARWLRAADELTAAQLELFWDERVGGFFFASTLHEKLIARSKLPTDNVTPSGNSVSAANLVYLAAALDKPEHISRAEKCIQSAAGLLEEHPASVVHLATAVSAWLEATAKAGSKSAPKK